MHACMYVCLHVYIVRVRYQQLHKVEVRKFLARSNHNNVVPTKWILTIIFKRENRHEYEIGCPRNVYVTTNSSSSECVAALTNTLIFDGRTGRLNVNRKQDLTKQLYLSKSAERSDSFNQTPRLDCLTS